MHYSCREQTEFKPQCKRINDTNIRLLASCRMNISSRNQTQAQMQMQNFVGFSKNRLRALRGVVYALKRQPMKAQRMKRVTTTAKRQNKLLHKNNIRELRKRADAACSVDVSSAFVLHSRLM